MQLNLKQAAENVQAPGEYTIITPNRYTFVVDSAQEKISKNSNTPMIEVVLRIDEGQEFANRKLWTNFSLSEKAQVYLVKFIEATGKISLLQEEAATTEQVCREIVGTSVSGYVKISGRGDKPRNEVGEFIAVTSANKVKSSTTTFPASATKKALFG